MTRKIVKATLVKYNDCKRQLLLRQTEEEATSVLLAQEGWHLLGDKDYCSNVCFQIALAKSPTDFPFWSY
jgi:hypothetical protein